MKKRQLVITHILYWLYFLIGVSLMNSLIYESDTLNIRLFFFPVSLTNYLLFITTFYTNYIFILPHFLKKKKYVATTLLWIALLCLFILLRYYIQEYLFLKYLGQCNLCGISTDAYFARNFLQGLNYLILPGTLIWFIDNWLKEEKQKRALQAEKLAAERAFLQSQVNPHFLFNTLNTIYSMVFHQSKLALNAIEKLSAIMRYALKEGQSDWVPLPVEISYLRGYMDLQQYRVKNPSLYYKEAGDLSSIKVPPMLLISFVENAFKHGVLNDPEHPIRIIVIAENNRLTFITNNKINNNQKDETSGVGLMSVRKRLELYYPSHHELVIENNEQFYNTKLIIQL
jgi:two-component system LytT family sensor kinase